MIIKKALITLCVLSVIVVPSSAQQPVKQQRPSMEYISPPAKPSPIPIYKFGETLEEQEKTAGGQSVFETASQSSSEASK